MKFKDLCKCKYAKVENGGGDSVTCWFVCKKRGIATDPENCERCRQEGKNLLD